MFMFRDQNAGKTYNTKISNVIIDLEGETVQIIGNNPNKSAVT
jgi:hypothetical protein